MEENWLSDRQRSSEAAVPAAFDLEECVREPIHLLGGVQSYGTLLAVDPDTGTVRVAAANTADVLGTGHEDLVGGPVTRVLSADAWDEARDAVRGPDADPQALLPVTVAGRTGDFDLSAHVSDGLVVLEFEPRRTEEAFRFAPFHRGVRRAVSRLREAADVEECCRAAVAEVRRLTGYERVVAYRFDGPEGPGEVIAEEAAEGWEPWLGLWFPATDIPPQARRLYRENWIRVIADVDDPTAGLHPPVLAAQGRPLDLSSAALRTVSGFHLEYLRNIGVRSSMSVSVVRDGELWGLIACHGSEPRPLAPEVRGACELFAAALSLQLAAFEERLRADALAGAGERSAALAGLLGPDVTRSLESHRDVVRALVPSDGTILVRGTYTDVEGAPVPPECLEWLRRTAAATEAGSTWSTDRLREVVSGAGEDGADAGSGSGVREPVPYADEHEPIPYAYEDDPAPHERASAPAPASAPAGVLLLPLGAGGDFLAWTRRERPAPRAWAADPARPVSVGPRGERLTPRGSGAVFRSVIRGRSLPWSPGDEATARATSRLLTGLVLRHAAELATVNDELLLTNADLDSFAHAAAHDLKEPLRGISNTVGFLREDAGDLLDAASLARLESLQRLAGRMDDLLNSLLHYSRLGRSGIRRRVLSLDTALDHALEVAGPRLAEEGVRVVRPGALPTVHADPDRLYEILVNLLTNAAKYAADRPDRQVEVGAGGPADAPVIHVRDNGIGIPEALQSEVFDLFRRLHGPHDHGGGSGVGLAIVKRVVERHGGELWLTSSPGEGTTISFTLGSAGADSPDA
ncbi:ATP-binding protein [Streptomyces sp. NPDC001941]|uniref:ATP-binding protein n=1 Tax=Streptomyces sp. NPDC001941 TaxID=3154659 RepID=UPI00332D2030